MHSSTLPQKTREFHNHHFDSTIWNDFNFRDDDIIIATYAKSGTTWMQQIISQLLYDGVEGLEVEVNFVGILAFVRVRFRRFKKAESLGEF